jgi:hypothetical protein
VDSVKDAPQARRTKTATSQKWLKIEDLIATDERFIIRYIAKCVGISVGAADAILRHYLKMRMISARWIAKLLTQEQTLAHVRIS